VLHRIERFNSQLRQEISDLISRELKDPRLGAFVTITAVEVSPDLSFAKVMVSRLGTEAEKKDTIVALTAAAGFIRHQLGDRMKARRIPELSFRFDETIEKADRVFRIMNKLEEERKNT
jgi:ribosome-binding factor A